MKQKFNAFDIEIAELVTGNDWKSFRPLGITCAAQMVTTKLFDWDEYIIFIDKAEGRLSKHEAASVVDKLVNWANKGYMVVTVNGLGFDFDILAEESGEHAACAELALMAHCDLMLLPLCTFGWPVGLQALAEGAGIVGKKKTVTLKDGSNLDDMSGSRAPEMWAAGEYDAVIEYLKDDVRATLAVAETAVSRGSLQWLSKSGRPYEVKLPVDKDGHPYLPTVAECLSWPVPDTDWMTDPLTRAGLTAWISALPQGEPFLSDSIANPRYYTKLHAGRMRHSFTGLDEYMTGDK